MKNIFFVGLMGAGKTTIGRLIAKQLGMDFHDSDHEVERKTGVKIPLIFELEGEAGFRKRETAAIQSLCELNNIVMATGGGAVLAPENRELLKNTAPSFICVLTFMTFGTAPATIKPGRCCKVATSKIK